jgi:hypothetical protein
MAGHMLIYLFHKCWYADFIIFTYIDPGSGSILLQFLFASAVGAVIYFRKFVGTFFRSMREKFSRKPK